MNALTDSGVILGIATKNGAYLIRSNDVREVWQISKPSLAGENVNKIMKDSDGRMYAATLSEGVFTSDDDGRTWNPSSRGLNVRKVWTLEADPHHKGVIFAGTHYGHLFKSTDSGKSWNEVVGLHNAPGRDKWGVDWGYGTTGLTIHTVRADPKKDGRMFIITSGTGAYRTDDGGETWKLLKNGVNVHCPIGSQENPYTRKESTPQERLSEHLEQVHSCFHKLVPSATSDMVYLQDHCGVFISENNGDLWKDVSPGENLRFGFPVDIVENGNHSIFVLPVPETPEICSDHNVCIRGQLSVYRSSDAGKTWVSLRKGLPDNVHTNVLRDSFSHDMLETPGLYFGTTTGELYASADLGESWRMIASGLGRIQGVTAMTT